MRILIIEDNEKLAKFLAQYLKRQGFTVDYVLDGDSGKRRIELYHKTYDLVVLDWMLPGKNGDEILKEIRENGITVPVLMLTAKDSTNDKVSGFGLGADDYLPKQPFYPEELAARIKALLRRPRVSLPPALKAGDIVLDPATRKVFKNSEEIIITQKEFSILEQLMRNRGRVLNREELFEHTWDFASNAMSNVIDVHMHALRKKVGGGNNKILETVPGVGYRIK